MSFLRILGPFPFHGQLKTIRDQNFPRLHSRSSITRLSLDDKALRSKEVSNQERDLLLTKSGLVSETIPERGSHLASSESGDSDIGKKEKS